MNDIQLKNVANIKDAIGEWNRTHHLHQEKLEPGSAKVNEIGQTILLHFDGTHGYWFEEVGYGNKVLAFFARIFRWLHIGFGDTHLSDPQKKQLRDLRNLFDLASKNPVGKPPEEVFAIKTANMKVHFGDECAEAYSIIMDPEPNGEAIEALKPKLKGVLKELEEKARTLAMGEIEGAVDFYQFKEKVLELLDQHLRSIQKEAMKKITASYDDPTVDIAIRKQQVKLLENAVKAEKVFKLFFAKVLDSAVLEPNLEVFHGISGKESIESIFADLVAFKEANEKSLEPNHVAILQQAISELEFAMQIDQNTVLNGLDAESRGKAANDPEFYSHVKKLGAKEDAKRIFAKLEEYAKNAEIPKGVIYFQCGTTSHSVVCKIDRVEGGKFMLSIVNTGEGLVNVKGKSRDVVYWGFTLNELSPEFLENLLMLKFEVNTMKQFYAELEASIGSHIVRAEGSDRYIQKKGTCSVRSVLAVLKDRLGNGLFRKFHVSMTERSLQAVEEAAKILSPEGSAALFPKDDSQMNEKDFADRQVRILLEKGQQILEKRKRKVR